MKKVTVLSVFINIVLIAAVVYLGYVYIDLFTQQKEQQREMAAAPVPVIYIAEGAFSEDEKQLVEERVVMPYQDYAECIGQEKPLVIRIEKSDTTGFLYSIEVLSKETVHAFLYGAPGRELEYYTPDLLLEECVDVLPHADSIRDQAVDRYQG